MSIKAPTESDVVRTCLDYLTIRGVWAWRQNQGAVPLKGGGYRRFVGVRGQSDIIGVLPGGRFLALEIKTKTGRLSTCQKQFLEDVRRQGGLALVIRDVRDLVDALDAVI